MTDTQWNRGKCNVHHKWQGKS